MLTGKAGSASTMTKIIQSPYSQAADLKNGMFYFSFTASLNWMEEQGKILFGPHFSVYPEDHSLIYKLLIYAIGDVEGSVKHGIELKKGLLVTGPVGCGKSTILTLLSYFFPVEKQYTIKSTREISFEFEKEGYVVINRFSNSAFRTIRGTLYPIVCCFDDLGVEQPLKYYGNECNVMAEILLSRYDLFISKGMITHITTNLSASELESIYGNRIRSRMREMFNLVAFNRNSKDKRI